MKCKDKCHKRMLSWVPKKDIVPRKDSIPNSSTNELLS